MSPGGKTILHVEDDPSLQRLVSIALERLGGYVVRTIGDGEHALRSVRQMTPDLVLLDVDLPGMNGIAVLRAMRATSRLHAIPAVFLTAADECRVVRETASLGVSRVMSKPFRARLLVETIDRVLRAGA